jgi:SAM-dependent methyltransferase
MKQVTVILKMTVAYSVFFMDHTDHVNLIRDGIPQPIPGSPEPGSPAPIWADLGSGRGAFTLALAELLPLNTVIYSVDRDSAALREQERAMRVRFPRTVVHYLPVDFTRPLNLPPLDGIMMANSLHFHRHKEPILAQIKAKLTAGGRLILVEYDTDRGNTWVPHPLSFPTWEKLAARAGFTETRLLSNRSGRFLGGMYSAVSW